jgi:hypothetical protein
MEEQRKADGQEMERQIAKKTKTEPSKKSNHDVQDQSSPPAPKQSSNNRKDEPRNAEEGKQPINKTKMEPTNAIIIPREQKEILLEPGAWMCRSCGNHNFASRKYCNSKTCDERRPYGISQPPSAEGRGGRPARRDFKGTTAAAPKSSSSSKRKRHDPETSKSLEWAPNASQGAIEKNLELRRRYQESNEGEGMSAEDIERAKLLLGRDARKRQKKKEQQEQKQKKGATTTTTENENNVPKENPSSGGADSDKSGSESKETTTISETTGSGGKGDDTDNNKNINTNTVDDDDDADTKKAKLKEAAKKLHKENKKLRKKFQKTKGGVGMSEQEVERAKILVERDARKKQRKEAAAKTTTS